MAATEHAATAEETSFRRARNLRLRQAVHRHKATSRQGIQERLFTLAFSGLVYPQIWEDPVVDLDALGLKTGERLIAIASGGCNVLSYLSDANIFITAVDLNPAHVALNKLKLAALTHLVEAGEPVPLGELAEQCACVRSNITQLVDRLEADRLVERVDDPADRRSLRAAITPLGRERQAAGARKVQEVRRKLGKALAGIDPVALKRALEQLR